MTAAWWRCCFCGFGWEDVGVQMRKRHKGRKEGRTAIRISGLVSPSLVILVRLSSWSSEITN
jgi:hypothetical protein